MSNENETKAVEGEVVTPAPKIYIVGASISHLYQVAVAAESSDEALLAFDDWIRGNVPANTLQPEIRATNLDIIGMGVMDGGGSIKDAEQLQDGTKKTLSERGALPETGCIHLFPAPAGAVEAATGSAEIH